ncbi:hypothetical protein [Streptomyces sp. NPDC057429]|uniref:hypothetical protein n=1 Tax=Streptomyces sp. NPDC057429 TaxID=3346130 RepID=UPI00369D587E
MASVELRYSPSAQCGWGRVFGNPGTTVWVDRSSDGGSTWQGKLGEVAITTPGLGRLPTFSVTHL